VALPDSRALVTLVFLMATTVLTVALLSQYVGGLAPCELCLYERWPYYAALPLALALTIPATTGDDLRVGAVLLTAIFGASAVLAFYHVGVEQHWFAGPTACTDSGPPPKTIQDLRELLHSQQAVRCDAPQWSFHEITLAGLNLLASLALCALSAAALKARR
jgi:disulfide bond formation protein DsbB